MTDFTPFEEMLRGHAGLFEDTAHDRWVRAQRLFEERAYREAAVLLAELISEAGDVGHELTDARLLLARAYFHSAQLRRAEEALLRVLELDPSDHYARLMLGRTLQRQGRLNEARTQLRLAATMHPDPAYQEALGEINARIANLS